MSQELKEADPNCTFCGTTEGLKQFPPGEGSDDEEKNIAFCEECFFSDECTSEEPLDYEDKRKLWNQAPQLKK